ncbi:zinc finger CCCH domain-containing protein 15-like isoform X2 [Hibiscus syriacus]|uniref:zinc finger CCCH domain-containing protein 15-like isoform X2 n=1 Tax=Hibiscus syriacus TaxID=106335 RepID=UPI0019216E5E|nr:zinc finger CCCH domain-containing protein 15-like isoform X2 [Hibiscus syriacus]
MQDDRFSTVYGDFGGKQPNDHQSDGVYSSTTTSSSTSNASMFALYNPRILMQQHQDMINRHNLCLTRLREAAKEAEALRQENSSLRSVNLDLNKQLSALIQASVQNHFSSSDYNSTPFELVNALRGLCLGSGGVGEADISDESPTSVMEGAVDVERVMLPKSISVRSNGYLKMMNQAGVSHRGKACGPTRTGNTSQLSGAKVYVQGGKKEEEPLELEVYNQGMFKTELCNKWQETGACPYGDHCQFAHGIEELRPVIRHPRYKTEVCRMVLAGDVCPYGHRCHFRHALTEQEKFMDHPKPRAR